MWSGAEGKEEQSSWEGVKQRNSVKPGQGAANGCCSPCEWRLLSGRTLGQPRGTSPLWLPSLMQQTAQRRPCQREPPPSPGSPARAAVGVAVLATAQIPPRAAFNFSAKERVSQRRGLAMTRQRLGT